MCVRFGRDGEVVSRDPETEKERVFEFDAVFPSSARQAAVFDDMEPLITSVLDGYNVSVFAYGQVRRWVGGGRRRRVVHDRFLTLGSLDHLVLCLDNLRVSVSPQHTMQTGAGKTYTMMVRRLIAFMWPWGGGSTTLLAQHAR